MDDKDFKQLLDTVATWEIPKIELDGHTKTRLKSVSRRNMTKEELYEAEHEVEFFEMFGGVNPSFPPVIKEIKTCDTNCDDCGKICKGGRKMEHKKHFKEDEFIWRNKCLSCGLTQDPRTKEFVLDTYHANKTWNLFLNQEGYRRYKMKNDQN